MPASGKATIHDATRTAVSQFGVGGGNARGRAGRSAVSRPVRVAAYRLANNRADQQTRDDVRARLGVLTAQVVGLSLRGDGSAVGKVALKRVAASVSDGAIFGKLLRRSACREG